jgi:hypothetical protein
LLTPPAPPATAAEDWKPVIPEGMKLEQKGLDAFTGWVKENKIDGKAAQKLFDQQVEAQKQAEQQRLATVTGWAEETKADKEIGGVNFDQTMAAAKRIIDRVASPGLRELLQQSGLGNHKEVIRFMAKIGSLISEDRLPGGGNGAAPGGTPSRYDLLKEAYPNSPEMWGQP